MPCSRSARRPSVNSARSTATLPRRLLVRSMAANWSSKMPFESYSSRPISVLLPSSTDPAVEKRRRSTATRCPQLQAPLRAPRLEVAFFLAVFHRRLRERVVGAGGAARGDPGGGRLGHDLLQRGRTRCDGAGAGHVAHGAIADGHALHLLVVADVEERVDRHVHAVAPEDLTLVGVVDAGHLQLLVGDVLPDVHLGPVGDREDAHVLALPYAAVVDVPQLGALVARIPLAELVAQREHPLLGACLFLVAPAAAEDGVEAVLLDRVEEGNGLQPVARRVGPRLFPHAALVDRLLDRR